MAKLWLVRVDYHGEVLPNEPAIHLHEGDNTFGKHDTCEHHPSSDKIQWGRRQAIIRVKGSSAELEDLGSSGVTFVGDSVDVENLARIVKQTKKLDIGTFILLGKGEKFDNFRLMAKLPPNVQEEELQIIPDPKPAEPPELIQSAIQPVHTDNPSIFPSSINPQPDNTFPNMNISINYPTNNPNPVSIRIEGSPTKPVAATSMTSGNDGLGSTSVGSSIFGTVPAGNVGLRKSLTFADDLPLNGDSSSGLGMPFAAQSRSLPSVEVPKKSALKAPTKSTQNMSFPSLNEPSKSAEALIAEGVEAIDNVVNRIVGAISVFPEFDADSIPDYVMMEAVAESVLSTKESSAAQLQVTVLELRELCKQCFVGAAIDDSLLHNQVSIEFDAIFRDLVISILTNAINCAEALLRNNLFIALKLADDEKYDIGAFRFLFKNRDRLVELLSYYQQESKIASAMDFDLSKSRQQFEVMSRCINPIVADVEKIKAILEFINRQADDASKAKKVMSRSSSIGNQVSELRSLKGKQKLMKRILHYIDNAISRQNMKAFNKWKQEVTKKKKVSERFSGALKLGSVVGRWRKRNMWRAFARWVQDCNIKSMAYRKAKEHSQLQMDILVLQSKLHDLTSTSNLQATLAGERAINRELSQTNAELSQIIRDLESKYLEFCQLSSSATKPIAQRLIDVRSVFMGQEEELAQSRKKMKAMTEYLHEIQKACEQANIIVSNNEKWRQFQGDGDDRYSNGNGNSPPHKSILRNIDFGSDQLMQSSGPGPLSSRAAATNVILFEVRRLRQSMMQAREEAQNLKKQVAAEVSKRVQLNLVIQDLDRRLTDTHKGYMSLRKVLIDTIGEGGLLDVLKQVEDLSPGFSGMLHPVVATSNQSNLAPTTSSRY